MRPLVLVILDGWGYSPQKLDNAIASAQTPIINSIWQNYPTLLLQASAKSVGLEWGEPGNSEVGHLTLGAGRTINQYSTRINQSISSGSFFENPVLLKASEHVRQHNSSMHFIGLLGSGTVHSSLNHLEALIDFAKKINLPSVQLHLFTDGKDSGLKEAPTLIKKLQTKLTETGVGFIATIIGRMYPMDRDTNWDRTQTAFNLWTKGEGEPVQDIMTALATAYEKEANDTTLPPMVLNPAGIIKENDAIVFFNFREDSMRQIAHTFLDAEFKEFPRVLPANVFITVMTQYLEAEESPYVIFPLPEVKNGLAEIFSLQGQSQLHLAETEKYAHTTYFFNCLHSKSFQGEKDIIIPSDKDHASHPEMRAKEIGETFAAEFSKNPYPFSIINFANADILSHTGNLEVTTKGIAAIDSALAIVQQTILTAGGIMIITADHGNAESLTYTGTGEAETKHNLNPVPFYLVAQEFQRPRTPQDIEASVVSPQGIISDVAPTILELLQIPIPVEMTGSSLLSLIR